MQAAPTVPSLFEQLNRSDPSGPRVTWYGAGERVEFSARTLGNWVNKTANLLVEEYDLGPGDEVQVDLPTHWRTVVFDLAIRSVGATPVLTLTPGAAPPALVVTSAPDRQGPGQAPVLAVELASLARRVVAELPSDTMDYNAEVAGYDDVFLPTSAAPLPAPPDDQTLTVGARVLVRVDDPAALARVRAALLMDGSVVLAGAEVSDDVLAEERVCAT